MYNLVVLRLSGGILKAGEEVFDAKRLDRIGAELASVVGRTQMVVVVGGGNIARGRDLMTRLGFGQELADNVGIIATILNAYTLGVFLSRLKIPNVVVSPHNVGGLIPPFRQPSVEHISGCLSRGRLVIVGGGTGKGGVTTDTAAVRLGQKLKAGVILKGTDVDGICSTDPKIVPDAKLIPSLSCRQFKDRGLSQILDPTAVEETTIPIGVFNILTPGLLRKAIDDRLVGSLLTPTPRLTV